jgi:flagellar biogenesis protein FliO
MSGALATTRTMLSLAAVVVLLAGFIWALRRGSLRMSSWVPRGSIVIETATSLGDRRSLAIVSVEGRRVLVGLTPSTVSFIADLAPRSGSSGTSVEEGTNNP